MVMMFLRILGDGDDVKVLASFWLQASGFLRGGSAINSNGLHDFASHTFADDDAFVDDNDTFVDDTDAFVNDYNAFVDDDVDNALLMILLFSLMILMLLLVIMMLFVDDTDAFVDDTDAFDHHSRGS